MLPNIPKYLRFIKLGITKVTAAIGNIRVTEAGDDRITEDGNRRILEN